MESKEKREAPRVVLDLKIRLKKDASEPADFDWIRNISLTGAFVETKREFHVSDVLDFEIYLEGGVALLSGKSRVVRCVLEPVQGIGIVFHELSQSDQKKLKKITSL
jgi:hypothetical protein